ncbi:enolase C-terminal domain-like protein [Actinopolymorpha sp. NPDC004070]|uniref:enolase C-terminal domain-like protein n=1 Tax=Actinopolymorpha sp. NPDC004070 TaxID=3154548 RepID=UPI0033A67922
MRITDVKVDVVDAPPGPTYRWRRGIPGSSPGNLAVVRVLTDSGVEGVAYARRGSIVAEVVARRLRDELVGQNPLLREYLWHRVWEVDRIEELPIYALGVLDVALWDLAGKAAGVPVHQLLGGFRTSIPAYASTVTFASVEEYLDVADQCLALGYPAIKLHAWGDAREDARLCVALREHVGDEVPLMYDGSAGFDLPDALYLGHALSDAGYLWYEEPMREFSITAYRILSEKVRIPLLVAETSDGAHMNTADFITAVSPAFVRTSAAFKGGITGAMRIAHLADAFRIRAEVHGGGVVNRNLCMAIPNTTYYESLIYTNPVQREAAVGPDGHVQAPTAPGIGHDM